MGVFAVVLACGASPPASRAPAVAKPAVVEALPAQGRFAPASAAAAGYRGAVEIEPRDALDRQILATLQTRSVSARPMHLDDALSRAAAELAATEPDDRGFSEGLVDFALHCHGIVDPSPRIYVVWSDPARPELVAPLLAAKLADKDFYHPALRVGIGVGPARDGVAPILVALLGTRISLAPLPRALASGAPIALDVTIDQRLRDPQLTVVHEDGRIDRLPLGEARPACPETPEALRLDLDATHDRGLVTIASFPVYCGMSPPAEYRFERAAIVDGADDLERRLTALVNRDRRAADVPLLLPDRESTAAARAHARERLAGAVVRIPEVPGAAFTAVTARDLRTAYEALANGTAGREHLLAATTTHLGVGVARASDGTLHVTLIYRRVPPNIDPAEAARFVSARVGAWLKLAPYAPLANIAGRFADELVGGVSQQRAWSAMTWWFQDLHGRFRHFNYSIAFVPEVELTSRHALVVPGVLDAFGVAVRQADHPRFGPNTIWIVVLYGERR